MAFITESVVMSRTGHSMQNLLKIVFWGVPEAPAQGGPGQPRAAQGDPGWPRATQGGEESDEKTMVFEGFAFLDDLENPQNLMQKTSAQPNHKMYRTHGADMHIS